MSAAHARPLRVTLRDAEGSLEVPLGPLHHIRLLSCVVTTTGRLHVTSAASGWIAPLPALRVGSDAGGGVCGGGGGG